MLFGSEHEFRHLTGCGSLTDCIASLSAKVTTLVITRGPDGAVAVEGGEQAERPAAHVERVVDTTGAGDLFAAGFLAARCRGHGLARALDTGAICSAEVISHFGARPEADLKELTGL
jgi:sugar/nucleoside kinase (ribokinase family)